MPLRRREFEGEMWEWGRVPRTKQPGWYPWRGRRFMPDVRRGRGIGARRGEWQWRGHAPGWYEGYGWEFRGGAPRGEHLTWPENVPARGMEGGRLRAEIRAHGLPEDRERFEAEGDWTPGATPRGPRGRRSGRTWRYEEEHRPRRARRRYDGEHRRRGGHVGRYGRGRGYGASGGTARAYPGRRRRA